MRSSRMAAAAGAVATALALILSACGSDSGSGSASSSGNSIVDKAKDEQALNIGVKPDQPGLGLQSQRQVF